MCTISITVSGGYIGELVRRVFKTNIHSGAGTNLKVRGGGRSGAKRLKNSFCRAFPMFWLKISRFGERFCDGRTVWSVSCLLFFYSRCPLPSHLQKWGARAPCPMESAPLNIS